MKEGWLCCVGVAVWGLGLTALLLPLFLLPARWVSNLDQPDPAFPLAIRIRGSSSFEGVYCQASPLNSKPVYVQTPVIGGQVFLYWAESSCCGKAWRLRVGDKNNERSYFKRLNSTLLGDDEWLEWDKGNDEWRSVSSIKLRGLSDEKADSSCNVRPVHSTAGYIALAVCLPVIGLVGCCFICAGCGFKCEKSGSNTARNSYGGYPSSGPVFAYGGGGVCGGGGGCGGDGGC